MTLGLVALALSLLGIVIVSIVGNTCYLQGGCTISLDDLLRRLGIQTQTMPEVQAQPNVDDPYVPNTLPNSYEAENLTDLTLDQVLDQFPQPTSTVQPTAIATVNPLPITPNPTATPDDGGYDISLGIERYTNKIGRPLRDFTFNLRSLYGRNNIYNYKQWETAPEMNILPGETQGSRMNNAFFKATRNANIIHFNLESISNPREYAAEFGAGMFGLPGTYFTAVELYQISNIPELCDKTVFYQNGSTSPWPDYSANIEICNQPIS